MSKKQTILLKSFGLLFAVTISLCACQGETQAPTTEAGQAADSVANVPEIASTPQATLTGVIPGASVANNEHKMVQVTSCNIELANKQSMDGEVPAISGAADINILGWFVDQAALSIGDPLVLKITNADQSQFWEVPLSNRTERQDIVATYKNNANLGNAGFDVVLNLSQFPKGRYNVYLSHTIGTDDQICGQGRSITVD